MTITIRKFSRDAAFMLAGCLLFIAGATYVLVSDAAPRPATPSRYNPAGWAGGAPAAVAALILFGAGAVIAARDCWKIENRIVIDDHGLLDERSGFGVISWADVRGAELRETSGGPCIWIALPDDPVRYPGSLNIHASGEDAWLRPAAGGMLLDLTRSPIPAHEVLATILEYVAADKSRAAGG